MSNPITTSLPAYVEQNKTDLIAKSVLDGRTVGYVNLLTEVVGPTSLNLVDTDVVLQDGSDCGFNDAGTTTLSQRVLTPAILKVNTTFCPKNLLKTYAQYQVKVGAGRETLPFEDKFTQGIVDGVKAQIEKLIWTGKATETAQFDGYLTILESAANVIKGTATGASKKIEEAILKLPAEIIEKEDTVLFVGEDLYREYILDLVKANLYHYEPSYGQGVYVAPGTNIRIISVNGLNGSGKVVGGRLSNFYYGVDMANDEEVFDLWWSKDDQIFKLAINFAAGAQIAYPEEVVVISDAA